VDLGELGAGEVAPKRNESSRSKTPKSSNVVAATPYLSDEALICFNATGGAMRSPSFIAAKYPGSRASLSSSALRRRLLAHSAETGPAPVGRVMHGATGTT
jgi:hypothetical protein